MTFEIETFDPKNASALIYEGQNRIRNRIRLEILPDDPPIPLDETINGLQNIPDFVTSFPMVVWNADKTEMVGIAFVALPNHENLHLAQFSINVLPEFRQKGIGKTILSKIADIAKAENRTTLLTASVAKVPAGGLFLEKMGATRGLEAHTNQLVLAELNAATISETLKTAQTKADKFETGLLVGAYPDEMMPGIVALYELVNQQPMGNLDVEDFHFSAEHIRQMEKSMFMRGNERWSIYAREKESGDFAGFTEIIWNPSRPEIINQEFTGVDPRFRGNGLGKLIKVEMLDKILKEKPEAKFVRTGNADVNAPMLKINKDLGFKPYHSECVWQVTAENVFDYLSAS